MEAQPTWTDDDKRLLDPVDRISEVLFGLIMAVTFVGSLSVATAGRSEVREALVAALGCNLAWGLVDAVMYLVRTATDRARRRSLARSVLNSDTAQARQLIRRALPPGLAPLVGEAELDSIRTRLSSLQPDGRPLLRARDFAEGLGIFLLVVLATFPVVAPFVIFADLPLAMQASRWITLGMLFFAGAALGRVAGHRQPLITGLGMAAFGGVLIVVVIALGG